MLIECGRIYPRVWRALLGPSGPLEGAKQGGERRDPSGRLDRKLCQVVGLNQNYVSASGTLYHVQIEDLGPVVDRVSEAEVRRVNVIVYSNYGEPNARIVHGHDHDFEDIRTHEHNLAIKRVIQDLAVDARRIVEEQVAGDQQERAGDDRRVDREPCPRRARRGVRLTCPRRGRG